ncbi:MAG: glycosyltransferase family 4 protein [Fibrobacteria bacterium]
MPTDRGVRAMLITTDYPPDVGGLQTYSYRIARELPGGLLAHVLAGSDHAARDLPPPDSGVGLSMRPGRTRWRAFAWSMWSIPVFFYGGRADFMLHMQWTTAIPSLILKRLGAGNRYLVLVHGAELIDPGRPLMGLLKKAVLSGADAVVAGSHHTSEIIAQLGIKCRRLEVIPYGNPLEGEYPPPPRHRSLEGTVARLLCMHRLVARKGTALLLMALEGLLALDWTLDIVGGGPEEAALKELALRLGLGDRVRFHPPVLEAGKIRLYGESDLFILPSLPPISNNHVEGLGLTLLEAQSQGLPVLAARTGGIPEAILENRTGLLFRAGDAQDLREKLADLLAKPDRLHAMGAEGPEWVRSHFSWQDGLKRLADLIREIAG